LSQVVEAQYKTLGEVKRVEEKISRLQAEQSQIPLEISKWDEQLSVRRETYETEKQTFDTTQKKLRAAEQELKEREEELRKAEEKMMEVKTNEAYQAAMKENETRITDKNKLEDEILTMMNDLETEQGRLKEAENVFKEHEIKVTENKKQLEEEKTKVGQLLDEQTKLHLAFVSQLEPDIAKMYQWVSNRVKGVAITGVENGRCLGCHVRLRIQLYNEILGHQTIHRCSTCGKILIPIELDSQKKDMAN